MNNKFYTLLHAAQKSAAHYQVAKQTLNELTSSEIFSNTFRDILHDKVENYVLQPDFGNCTLKANKAARDEWRALNENKQSIKHEDWDMMALMRNNLFALTDIIEMKNIELPEFLYNGITIPPMTLLEHNGKYYYHTAVIDISPKSYAESCIKYGLLYRLGLQHLALTAQGLKLDIKDIVIVAVEKTAPHSVVEFTYHLDTLVQQTIDALDKIVHYESTNDATLPKVAHYNLADLLG